MTGVELLGDLIKPEEKDAMSHLGSILKLRGDALEKYLVDDVTRILRWYSGWDIVHIGSTKPTSEIFKQIAWNGDIPDVDFVLIDPFGKVQLILSSKSSFQDNSAYASILHIERYHKMGIKYIVITKDSKGVLCTGNSKYLRMLPAGIENVIFVNNDKIECDKDVQHQEVNYKWSNIVKPYYKLHDFLASFIESSTTTHSHFFNFETGK
jgi:hypothetical protein